MINNEAIKVMVSFVIYIQYITLSSFAGETLCRFFEQHL